MDRTYLDHNATSPVRPEVAAVWQDAIGRFGNPSSIHHEGRVARAALEDAREQVARLVGASPADVIFTSGATEANALALRPGALQNAERRPVRMLLVGATEHPCVLEGHGFTLGNSAVLPVDRHGLFDPDELVRLLGGGDHDVVLALQLANSETGVIQLIKETAARVHERGGVLHCDAVQAAGRLPIAMGSLGIDALALSSHKLGGPMGVGALVLAPGRAGPDLPLLRGGGQERGRRGGTENVPGIVGFGVAAECAARDLAVEAARLRALRDGVEREIRRVAPDAVVFGAGVPRLPNTLAFAVPGLSAATALMALDLDGVAVSSGSACSSGKVGRSHVLAAMGVDPDLAAGAIRLSFGWNSSQEDVMRFARSFENVLRRLYRGVGARAA